MKFSIKTMAAVFTIAALINLTGCGSSVEVKDNGVAVPSIDTIPTEVATVAVREANIDNGVITANEFAIGEEDGFISSSEEITDALADDEVTRAKAADEKKEENYPFDEEFFSNSLFVGDSISTGYSGYAILPEKNVFAKIGLNPLSALDTEITTPDGDIFLKDEIAAVKPERAFIMLGSNGMEWLACSNMIDGMSDIIDAVTDASPDTQIVILSVPPVTYEYDCSNEEVNITEKIHDFNSRLETLCGEKSVDFVDITSMLETRYGYFIDYLAEVDGMHFKPTAYKMILNKLETIYS